MLKSYFNPKIYKLSLEIQNIILTLLMNLILDTKIQLNIDSRLSAVFIIELMNLKHIFTKYDINNTYFNYKKIFCLSLQHRQIFLKLTLYRWYTISPICITLEEFNVLATLPPHLKINLNVFVGGKFAYIIINIIEFIVKSFLYLILLLIANALASEKRINEMQNEIAGRLLCYIVDIMKMTIYKNIICIMILLTLLFFLYTTITFLDLDARKINVK